MILLKLLHRVRFYEFSDYFVKCIIEESISKIDFMIKNLNIEDIFLFGGVTTSLQNQKIFSFKFLFKKLKELKSFDSIILEIGENLESLIDKNIDLTQEEKILLKNDTIYVSENLVEKMIYECKKI
uniref:Uncharacterized protein n=1 Tax=viral metagenome TaxID=1070528 RepID=A0A6C0AET0_9ZZZZ